MESGKVFTHVINMLLAILFVVLTSIILTLKPEYLIYSFAAVILAFSLLFLITSLVLLILECKSSEIAARPNTTNQPVASSHV